MREEHHFFRIVSHVKATTSLYIDEVTGKLLEPPKEVPEQHLVLKNRVYLYHLYIPAASGRAILIEPTGNAEASWVGMRFGKCRKTS